MPGVADLKISCRAVVAATFSMLLGLGSVSHSPMPAANAAQKPKIVDIAIGPFHVLALDSDGGVWSWGRTVAGSLGHGDLTDLPAPRKIASLPPVTAVAVGVNHSVALDKDGNVWVWGDNTWGQFGNGEAGGAGQISDGGRKIKDDENSNVPVKNGLSRIQSIAAGDTTTYAVDREGRVYAWGGAYRIHDANLPDNLMKQEREKLLPGKIEGLEQIVYVTSRHGAICALDINGDVWCWTPDLEGSVPEKVQGLDNVRQVRVWQWTKWAQENDGTWKQWGPELFDDSGLAPDIRQIHRVPTASPRMQGFIQIEVSTHMDHSLVGLKPDGTVWTWGSNAEGQLGVPGTGRTSRWIQVELPHRIAKVAAFDGTVFAITEAGGLYSWGCNAANRLGDGWKGVKRFAPKLLPAFGADEETAGSRNDQPTTGRPSSANPVTFIYLNGNQLDLDAVIIRGHTMVPFRGLFEAFDMDVAWDQGTKTATATKDGLTLRLTVGSGTARVNGEKRELSVAPVAINGRIFVNLRFVSETLGARVEYRKLAPEAAEVFITYKN